MLPCAQSHGGGRRGGANMLRAAASRRQLQEHGISITAPQKVPPPAVLEIHGGCPGQPPGNTGGKGGGESAARAATRGARQAACDRPAAAACAAPGRLPGVCSDCLCDASTAEALALVRSGRATGDQSAGFLGAGRGGGRHLWASRQGAGWCPGRWLAAQHAEMPTSSRVEWHASLTADGCLRRAVSGLARGSCADLGSGLDDSSEACGRWSMLHVAQRPCRTARTCSCCAAHGQTRGQGCSSSKGSSLMIPDTVPPAARRAA